MRQVVAAFAILALLGILVPATVSAFVAPEGEQVINPMPPVVMHPEVQKQLSSSPEWQGFISQDHGNFFKIRWNELTGTPHNVVCSGVQLPLPLDEGNIEERTGDFISTYSGLLKISPEQLSLLRAVKRDDNWYVCYQQVKDEIPVISGLVRLTINRYGKVIQFGSDAYPDSGLSTVPLISEDEAEQIAKEALGFDPAKDQVIGCSTKIFPYRSDTTVTTHLTWEVKLSIDEPPGEWLVYVDAQSGDVVYGFNSIKFFDDNRIWGHVYGWFYPHHPADSTQKEPFALEKVKVYTDPPESTYTDWGGYYRIDVPSLGPYLLESRLDGQHVVVKIDPADGIPEALHSAWVYADGPHNWTWGEQGDELDDEVNVYYHATWIYGQLRLYTNPFQQFDLMDYYDRPMWATVRVYTDFCNAFYKPGTGDIFFGEGNLEQGCQNLSLDNDVIFHEYGHAIVHHIQAMLLSRTWQWDAMHEGFADYWAAIMNDDPLIGEGVLSNPSLWRSLDNSLRYPDDFIYQPHHDGQIISGALWDLRGYLGDYAGDQLFFEALFGIPMYFSDYLDQILIADDLFYGDADPSNGTPHEEEILHAFYDNHGIAPSPGGVSGHLTANTTWEDSLHLVGPVVVDPGVCLTISPGARVNADPWVTLKVEGTLKAQGTPTNYITITSDEGGWFQVWFSEDASDSSILSYCNIQNGYYGIYGNQKAMTISHCHIQNIPHGAIVLTNPSGTYNVSHNYIHSCGVGIAIAGSGTIEGNGVYSCAVGVDLSGTNLKLRDNWFKDNSESGADMIDCDSTCVVSDNYFFNNHVGMGLYNSSPLISQTKIENSDYAGIWCQETSSPRIADSSSISKSGTYGIICLFGSSPVICRCDIDSNGVWGLYNCDSTVTVVAESCWWGDASGPYDPSPGPPDYNPEGTGDKVSDWVAYRPWSEAPVVGVTEPSSEKSLPQGFVLSQNYPNPFNPTTVISYQLSGVNGQESAISSQESAISNQRSAVSLKVYNILGQEVKTLVDEVQAPGYYSVEWDGRDSSGKEVSSGIYIYRIQAGDFTQSKRMLLLK